MASVNRIGFTRLLGRDGARDDGLCRINIIFVHGLRGHPRHTWEDSRSVSSEDVGSATLSKRKAFASLFKSKPSASTASRTVEDWSGKVFWPDEYLTQDIPEARIWTYGYNADAISGLFQANNKNSVSQHGRDFAARIEREIENEDPMLFVAHSLGGIIVKDAIHKSSVCRKRTKLIVFFGTPHRGSSYAGWGEILANLALLALQDPNKKIVGTLEVDNEVLDNIHEEFKVIVHESGIRIHSFQEARGMSGMKGLHHKVVDDFSSKVDLPRSLETVESIDANHREMVRCSNRADPRYNAIVGVLKQFMKQFVPSTALGRDGIKLQEMPSTVSIVETQTTAAASADVAADYAHRPSYYIPFLKNKRFVGRDSTLDMLKQMLFIQKECQQVAVVGLGGVGKTQVALNFAYWAKENQAEYSIFWVPALSDATVEQAYTEIARRLPIHRDTDEESLKESVRRYLSSEAAGPWLLIVDNADDMDVVFGSPDAPGGISGYLPESESGLILFTTRSREVAVSVAGSDVVELQSMSLQEAMAFLGRSLIRKDLLRDEAVVIELVNELTYLPLAITQAAAYLNRNQVSIAEYLELLRGTENDTIGLMSREFYDDTRYRDSQDPVATTWLVSFNQIYKSDSAAADLLSFISVIEPKAIPRSILPGLESEEQMVHAIGTLCAYAFVVKREDSNMFDMHRLVHLATRIWVQKKGLSGQTAEEATRHLANTFPTANHENRSLWRQYIPHALKILQRKEGPDTKEKYELYRGVGVCLRADGRSKEAVRCLERSYEWTTAHLPEDHPSRLESQHGLAVAYRMAGKAKKAIELLEHVVAVQRTLTEEHPHRVASQHSLAVAYREDGQLKKAIELLEHVVAVRIRILAAGNPERLLSQIELAVAYREDGQLKKAIEQLEHIVAIQRGTLPEDHPYQLGSQYELARVYGEEGQFKKAVELLEHVVAIEGKTLADDDASRLLSQHELAKVYRKDGQLKRAVELLEYVITIKGRTLPDDEPSQLSAQHSLAIAYREDGQFKKAIELLEHVVAIEGKTLADDDPSRLLSQHELAKTYREDGQFKRAVELLEYIIAIKGRTLADEDVSQLQLLYELVMFYRDDRQVKKAVELLEHIVAIEGRTLADDDSSRLISQYQLAVLYREDRQVGKAVELLEHIVAVEGRILTDDNPSRLHSQHELAVSHRENGQIKFAVELLEHIVAVERGTLADDDHSRLVSQYQLAISYREDGQVKKAVELLEHIVAVERRTLADDDDFSQLRSYHTLMEILQAAIPVANRSSEQK